MKIKTFHAATMAEAMAEIKRDLGEDALILSSKEVEVRHDPGKSPVRSFEVVAAGNPVQESPAPIPSPSGSDADGNRSFRSPAALAARRAYHGGVSAVVSPSDATFGPAAPLPGKKAEEPGPSMTQSIQPLFSSPAVPITPRMAFARRQVSSLFASDKKKEKTVEIKPASVKKDNPVETAETTRTEAVAVPSATREKTPQTISREVVELKRLIRWSAQSVVSSRSQFPDADADALFVDLVANDMDESIARRILMEACMLSEKDNKRKRLDFYARNVFRESVKVAAMDERSGKRVVSIFVGPTGVGKTTTIAKLASRFALELGRKTLLITLDTYRIGAAEQLRIYADLIGIPLLVVHNTAELDRRLQEHAEAEMILIDTVGRAHSRLHQLQELAEYVREKEWIEKHLVLSLATKPLDLREITDAYELFFGIDKLLFTKLDETLTSGAAANELVRTQKPLSYMTNGQNVPQDIQIPTPASFAEFIVGRDYGADLRMAYA